MEPGHEDREYKNAIDQHADEIGEPQWSPVMKTGNTFGGRGFEIVASMPQWSPVMKTGNTPPSFPKNTV